MQLKTIKLAAVMALGIAAPAHAKDAPPPRILQATTSWNLEYAADSCLLQRKFGEGDEAVFLSLERMGPGDALGVILASKSIELVRRKPLTIRFGTEAESEENYLSGKGADGTTAVSIARVRLVPLDEDEKDSAYDDFNEDRPLISPEREAAVDTITLSNAFRAPLVLETESLGPPMEAMRTCTDDLLKYWGIDVAAHATLSRKLKPTRSPGKWITSRDYPAKMWKAGYSGTVYFRLSVDATGKTTECHIQKLVGDQEFADEVCKQLIRTARFEPALDKDGQPLPSYYRSVVRFQT